MHRLFIYLTYDRQNIIDDYIGYFLRRIRPIADTVAVVCNMPRIEKGIHNLTDYADHIFYRENIGLDAGGFKDALCTFIGWDWIKQYDELILANDSFYGPFDDFTKIFSEMESRNLDFWGLMQRGAGAYGVTGRDPEHILSFFYVFQAPMLHSREFQSYWEDMPYYSDYMTVVKQYERRLTKYFSDLGYTYGAYADTQPNETNNLRNQFFQCDYLSCEMIRKRNFPFLKRKQLSYNTLYYQTQENLFSSIDHIDKYTDYDVDLIWKNLIRTQNHTELQRSLGLQYVLGGGEEKSHDHVILCVRARWMNAAEVVSEYLEGLKEACDILIITDQADIKVYYQKLGFTVTMEVQSDADILQSIDTETYQYICLLHDTDLSSDRIPGCTGKSYFFNVWENLARDAAYIDEVVSLLETKPYMGMLMHPVPIFSTWLGKLGLGWENRYEDVKNWIRKLGLSAVTDEEIPPIHITSNFWVRASVINSFREKVYMRSTGYVIPQDLFPYLWSYFVQDSGHLTGIIESAFYAPMNETNYHYYLKTLMGWLVEKYGSYSSLLEYKEVFYVRLASERCRQQYEKWYVYGTGEVAKRCIECIKDTTAFVISDGQEKMDTFHGKPVIWLSELKPDEEFGLILCLSKENQDRVVELLEERGIKNYYTIY